MDEAARRPALVALRRERERTIETLTEAFSTDLLEVEEFEHRVDLAHQAQTLEALVPLTSDLEVAGASEALVPTEVDEEQNRALVAARPRRRTVFTIMGGAERTGSWRVPEKLQVVAIMGGVDLDFREAILAPGVTNVHVLAMMGGVDIVVPPNLAVECNGAGVLGAFEAMERAPAVPDPDAPLLRIHGVAFMGGFDISTRLPGESARQARRREKRERKEKRRRALEGGNKQLPPGR